MSPASQSIIASGALSGLGFIRLYIVDADESRNLQAAAADHDYVFAYSLADLGDVPGFERELKATQLVALDGTEDEVFADLNKNNRYKVRRSYRDEAIDVVVDDPDRAGSLEFYRTVKQADGVTPDIDEDFATVRWINAYEAGEMVSSTSWFDSGRVLRAKHIVSVRKQEGTDPRLIGRLTRRLFWEACVVGIAEGYEFVDLGGVDTSDEAKSGVADFKFSFGGETVDVFVYRRETEAWADLARQVDRVIV